MEQAQDVAASQAGMGRARPTVGADPAKWPFSLVATLLLWALHLSSRPSDCLFKRLVLAYTSARRLHETPTEGRLQGTTQAPKGRKTKAVPQREATNAEGSISRSK